jgi:hypothetical protein
LKSFAVEISMIKLFKVGGRCLDKNGDSVAKQIAKLAYNVEK